PVEPALELPAEEVRSAVVAGDAVPGDGEGSASARVVRPAHGDDARDLVEAAVPVAQRAGDIDPTALDQGQTGGIALRAPGHGMVTHVPDPPGPAPPPGASDTGLQFDGDLDPVALQACLESAGLDQGTIARHHRPPLSSSSLTSMTSPRRLPSAISSGVGSNSS